MPIEIKTICNSLYKSYKQNQVTSNELVNLLFTYSLISSCFLKGLPIGAASKLCATIVHNKKLN